MQADQKNLGKVKICFAESHDRDVVMSFASSLAEGCSIEAVIPDHLAPLQRHLESYAYKIRRNGKSGGKRVSTSVRLQDDGMTLALALKTEGERRWSYYSKEELKENSERLERHERKLRDRKAVERLEREEKEEIDLTGESEGDEEGMDDDEAGGFEEESGEYRSAGEEDNPQ